MGSMHGHAPCMHGRRTVHIYTLYPEPKTILYSGWGTHHLQGQDVLAAVVPDLEDARLHAALGRLLALALLLHLGIAQHLRPAASPPTAYSWHASPRELPGHAEHPCCIPRTRRDQTANGLRKRCAMHAAQSVFLATQAYSAKESLSAMCPPQRPPGWALWQRSAWAWLTRE